MVQSAFAAGFVDGTTLDQPLPPVVELLAMLRPRAAWDALTIASGLEQFPRALITHHHGHGFVIQCFESADSWSDSLVMLPSFTQPTVEVELGGQAVEKWPVELFVSENVAAEALEHFLAHGKQKPSLTWVRIDRFPRVRVWEHSQSMDTPGPTGGG